MVEDKYIKDFENWCLREHIRVIPNKEIFFINERRTLVPMFKLGTNTYAHIVDTDVPSEDDAMYQSFAVSFYTIMIIPKEVIGDLVKHFSRRDIVKHFKVSL